MVRILQILAGALLLGACTQQKHREAGLLFRDWYVVRPVVAGTGSVAYGTITNEGAALQTLQKAVFSCAGGTDLHETLTDGGRARMVPLAAIKLMPGETLVFEPGHKHVMLQKLEMQTDSCEAIFSFDAVNVKLLIPLRDRQK